MVRLLPDDGFIRASDGQDIYSHRNSVAQGGFEPMKVGGEVRLVLVEREDEEGPRASLVMAVDNHHVLG